MSKEILIWEMCKIGTSWDCVGLSTIPSVRHTYLFLKFLNMQRQKIVDRVEQKIDLISCSVYTLKCTRNYSHKRIMLSLNEKLLKWKGKDHSNTEEIHPLHVAKENSTAFCRQKWVPEFKTSALRSIIFHLCLKNICTNVPTHICLNWQIGLIFNKVIETGKWSISTASKKKEFDC